MCSPHDLSRPFAIDPAYSTQGITPSADGSSLFTTPSANDPAWLYAPGDLEGWQLARMRLEAFRICHNVFHPGTFPRFHPLVQFQKKLKFDQLSEPDNLPEDCTVSIWHSGEVHLSSGNGLVVRVEDAGLLARHTVDLRPLLREGEFHLSAVVTRTDAPPALLIDSPWLRTDTTWRCATQLSFHPLTNPVTTFARGALTQFPHDEKLPEITVEPIGMKDGCHDFGVTLLARPVIEISSGTATIFPGESTEEARSRDPKGFEQTPQTLSVTTPGTYADRDELAFRYLQIDCGEGGAEITKVSARATLYPAEYRGAFASSDETLTRIWMHSAYTLRLCMRELYIDGPKRDRLPWVGDVFIGALGNAVTFADSGIVRRTLTALFPEDPLRDDCNGIIDYSLYWILTLHRYLMFTGDLEFARNLWPQAKALLAALETREDTRGFLSSEKAAWVFIDWADIDKTGASAALQMLRILALDAATALGKELHDETAAAAAYATKAARLRRLVRKHFWNTTQNRYVDSLQGNTQSAKSGRHANFLALLAGLTTRSQTAHILDTILLNEETPGVGTPYMRYFENAALCATGRADAMLTRLRSYWGGMLDLGATTFWEGYDPLENGAQHLAFYGRPFAKSLSHAWASGPLHLLSADLIGLKPTAPGWKKFTAQMPAKMQLPWLCATIPTPHGDIHWEIEGRRGKITTPDGKQTDLRPARPLSLEIA